MNGEPKVPNGALFEGPWYGMEGFSGAFIPKRLNAAIK
jgi:hypothetical protein